MPTLNPDILRWARTTAGLSLEEAARSIELNDARGMSGPQRLGCCTHRQCFDNDLGPNGGTPVRLGHYDNYSTIPTALSALTLLITTALIYWDFSDRTVFRSFTKSESASCPKAAAFRVRTFCEWSRTSVISCWV